MVKFLTTLSSTACMFWSIIFGCCGRQFARFSQLNSPFIWGDNLHNATGLSQFKKDFSLKLTPQSNASWNFIATVVNGQAKFLIREDILRSAVNTDFIYFDKKSLHEKSVNTTKFSLSRSNFLDNFFDMELEYQHIPKVATFENVFSNRYGLIVNQKNQKAVRNGGCFHMGAPKYFVMDDRSLKQYDTVISLTSGASGTWHFPMESLVALAYVSNETLSSSYIHVPSKGSFILQWLQLLGISNDRIIDDNVLSTKTLIVPEMGRCGAPYLTQLNWLREMYLPKSLSERSLLNQIVLIKRTKSRTLSNFDQVAIAVQQYAAQKQWTVIIHSDDKLPPLVDQIRIFTQSKMVVAPHGAGELFAAFLSKDAALVELISEGQACLVYARMAYIQKIQYAQVLMNATNRVDVQQLLDAMKYVDNGSS